MVTLNPLSRLQESTVKAKSFISSGLTLMKRAECWVRISALCCRSNELTAYKSALYEENLKPWKSWEANANRVPILSSRLWNSCLLISCLRQHVRRLFQSKETSNVIALLCLLYFFWKDTCTALHFLGYQC